MATVLRCLIADDEAPARQRLRRLVEGLGTASVVGEAADGLQALEQVAACRPDVLLLDISMPELDGLGVAATLAAAPEPPVIVFVTAYDQHALRAFELAALDYLVKPVRPERLAAALTRAASEGARRTQTERVEALQGELRGRPARRMAARCGAKYIVFDPTLVFGIFAQDHYCTIQLEGRELLVDDSLDQWQRRFAEEQFVRVHRSAIINLHRVKELLHEGDRRYVAVLTDGAATRVPVSRERWPALRQALGLE